jgi:hypothetical protein
VGGASHGALHALDSFSIAVSGGAAAPALPAILRSVDIAPFCMNQLGLPMRYAVGEPRTTRNHEGQTFELRNSERGIRN